MTVSAPQRAESATGAKHSPRDIVGGHPLVAKAMARGELAPNVKAIADIGKVVIGERAIAVRRPRG